MSEAKSAEKFAKIVQRIAPQSRLLRAWSLKGGISAQVTALEFQHPDGQPQKVIVRRHGDRDRQHNQRIAADEFKLLQLLHAAGLPIPTPYFFDQSGEIFPTPYVVIEYIEGDPEFSPPNLADLTAQLAIHLAKIHQVDFAQLDLSFLPQRGNGFGERPANLDQSLEEAQIRDAVESIWPLAQQNRSGLLHGDFWPGNILWKERQLVAVIDWEDAKLGDPLADLANSRLDILWIFGLDAMHNFTQQYQSLTTLDYTNLPYWDLCAALRPASQIAEWAAVYPPLGRQDITEKTMREGHRLFVAQAFEQLAKQ